VGAGGRGSNPAPTDPRSRVGLGKSQFKKKDSLGSNIPSLIFVSVPLGGRLSYLW
jgi:hypothetical protein